MDLAVMKFREWKAGDYWNQIVEEAKGSFWIVDPKNKKTLNIA